MPEGPENKPNKFDIKAIVSNKNAIKNLILIILNLAFAVVFTSQLFSFISNNSSSSEDIINEGRKVTYKIPTDELIIAELSNEELPEPLQEKEVEEEIAEVIAEETTQEIVEEIVEEVVEKVIDYSTANLGIIVTEIGLKQENIDFAETLPKEVSFAFSPYSDELQNKIDAAVENGRETLINLMFEPSNYPLEDSGPLTVQSHFEKTQNVYRVQQSVLDKSKYIGFFTNTDEIVTHNLEVVSPVLLKIKEMEKFFLFYKQPVNSYLEKEAKPMAIDIGAVTYLIDQKESAEEIRKTLDQVKLELLERRRKIIIALRPYKTSINVLNQWLQENLSSKVQIAPISYFITDN